MASRTLISFMGKNPKGYSPVAYAFPSGVSRTAVYFGEALLAELRSHGQRIDQWIIIGTPTSGWDTLGECIPKESPDRANLGELIESVFVRAHSDQPLAEQDIQPLADAVGRAHDITMRVICASDDGDHLFCVLRDVLPEGCSVELDVTHGFRTMPLQALLALGALRWLKGIELVGVHYGSLASSAGTPDAGAPSGGKGHRLDTLSRMAAATPALAAHALRGDLSGMGIVLGQLPGAGEVPGHLAEAQRCEDLLQYDRASQARAMAVGAIRKGLGAVPRSFLAACATAVDDTHRELNLPGGAAGLAARSRMALSRSDFLRALAYAVEALQMAVIERDGLRERVPERVTALNCTEYEALSGLAKDALRDAARDPAAPSVAIPQSRGPAAKWTASRALSVVRACRNMAVHAAAHDDRNPGAPDALRHAPALQALVEWALAFHDWIVQSK